jgi:putative transposase
MHRAMRKEFQRLNGYSDAKMAALNVPILMLGELGSPEFQSSSSTRIVTPGRDSVFHIASRLAGDLPLWGPDERRMFRHQLGLVADYCGVQIFNYTILDNHFHLLVKVPRREAARDIPQEEMLRRIALLHEPLRLAPSLAAALSEEALRAPGTAVGHFSALQLHRGVSVASENESAFAWAERELERHRGLMCDLPFFIRLLKQRFSKWYNATHDRFGTLWADRFRSLLVEESAEAVQAVSAYIDFNAVRRGWVEDPSAYPFCGAGEAAEKDSSARQGLRSILSLSEPSAAVAPWAEVAEHHRSLLWGDDGSENTQRRPRRASDLPPRWTRPWVMADLFMNSHPVLLDGRALGREAFVESVFRSNRALFGANGTARGDWLLLRCDRNGVLEHWMVRGLMILKEKRPNLTV